MDSKHICLLLLLVTLSVARGFAKVSTNRESNIKLSQLTGEEPLFVMRESLFRGNNRA